jgi:hypothetical protein
LTPQRIGWDPKAWCCQAAVQQGQGCECGKRGERAFLFFGRMVHPLPPRLKLFLSVQRHENKTSPAGSCWPRWGERGNRPEEAGGPVTPDIAYAVRPSGNRQSNRLADAVAPPLLPMPCGQRNSSLDLVYIHSTGSQQVGGWAASSGFRSLPSSQFPVPQSRRVVRGSLTFARLDGGQRGRSPAPSRGEQPPRLSCPPSIQVMGHLPFGKPPNPDLCS